MAGITNNSLLGKLLSNTEALSGRMGMEYVARKGTGPELCAALPRKKTTWHHYSPGKALQSAIRTDLAARNIQLDLRQKETLVKQVMDAIRQARIKPASLGAWRLASDVLQSTLDCDEPKRIAVQLAGAPAEQDAINLRFKALFDGGVEGWRKQMVVAFGGSAKVDVRLEDSSAATPAEHRRIVISFTDPDSQTEFRKFYIDENSGTVSGETSHKGEDHAKQTMRMLIGMLEGSKEKTLKKISYQGKSTAEIYPLLKHGSTFINKHNLFKSVLRAYLDLSYLKRPLIEVTSRNAADAFNEKISSILPELKTYEDTVRRSRFTMLRILDCLNENDKSMNYAGVITVGNVTLTRDRIVDQFGPKATDALRLILNDVTMIEPRSLKHAMQRDQKGPDEARQRLYTGLDSAKGPMTLGELLLKCWGDDDLLCSVESNRINLGKLKEYLN